MKYHKDLLLVLSMHVFEMYEHIVHVYAILLVDFETKPNQETSPLLIDQINIHTCTRASVN
jgi:hypothetical protein